MDGLDDIATGWEEGGIIRAYTPWKSQGKRAMAKSYVGKVKSPEDATDLDNDGAVDVISS